MILALPIQFLNAKIQAQNFLEAEQDRNFFDILGCCAHILDLVFKKLRYPANKKNHLKI